MPIERPYKLAALKEGKRTVVNVSGVSIGESNIVVIAGPCSVESAEQIIEAAKHAMHAGVRLLRGGAYKPRTSPYAFQGLGEEGLKYLAEARKKTGLPIVTEAMDIEHISIVEDYADMIQLGARNMQNFSMLKALGRSKKPVLLKRGFSSTFEELLLSAEYILSGGNPNVVLCERGIRTFEPYTRFTLDISAVPSLKELTHLPVVVDPSHGTGKRSLVPPMARAAVAAGADGLLIEMHPHPEHALCDGAQSLIPDQLSTMMDELGKVARAVGREL